MVKVILKRVGAYPGTINLNLLLDFAAFLPASLISLKRTLELHIGMLVIETRKDPAED